MKRITSLIIAVVLLLAMAVPAMAANAPMTGHTFAAYQIFTGTQDENGKLSNIVWGSGINGAAFLAALKAGTDSPFASCTDAAGVAEIVATYSDDSAEAKAFAALAYNYVTGDGTTVVDGVAPTTPGYYLVVDVTPGPTAGQSGPAVYNLALLQLTGKGTFEIRSKVDLPTVDKEIVGVNDQEYEEPVEANSASVGDVVNYKVTGTLPSNLADYEIYYYQFVDTLSAGLTYNGDMVIKVGETEVTTAFNTTGTEGQNIVATCSDVKAIAGVTINENTTFVITYSAKLNENALIGTGNTNEVSLIYSNNPNESGDGAKGTTPGKKVETFVTELDVFKYTGDNTPLIGAEFTLSGDGVKKTKVDGTKFVAADYALQTGESNADNKTYYLLKSGAYTTTAPDANNASAYADIETSYKLVSYTEWITKTEAVAVKAFVGADGHLVFTGLGEGEYTLTESVTPAGYNTIAPIKFTITFDPATKTFTANNGVTTADGNKLAIEVLNNSGTLLPETGGVGTTIFYVLGGILLIGAAVLLITKKRMEAMD